MGTQFIYVCFEPSGSHCLLEKSLRHIRRLQQGSYISPKYQERLFLREKLKEDLNMAITCPEKSRNVIFVGKK
jgi:hypothetical protein